MAWVLATFAKTGVLICFAALEAGLALRVSRRTSLQNHISTGSYDAWVYPYSNQTVDQGCPAVGLAGNTVMLQPGDQVRVWAPRPLFNKDVLAITVRRSYDWSPQGHLFYIDKKYVFNAYGCYEALDVCCPVSLFENLSQEHVCKSAGYCPSSTELAPKCRETQREQIDKGRLANLRSVAWRVVPATSGQVSNIKNAIVQRTPSRTDMREQVSSIGQAIIQRTPSRIDVLEGVTSFKQAMVEALEAEDVEGNGINPFGLM